MPKNKILTNRFGVSLAYISNGVIELLNHKKLSESKSIYKGVPESALLQEVFAPFENFYYSVEKVDSSGSIEQEYGYGELQKVGKKWILNREVPVIFNNIYSETELRPSSLHDFAEGFYIVRSSIPPDADSLFAYKNSVLCSSESFVPCPVELQTNTLLGCKDDMMQSIDRNELLDMLDLESTTPSKLQLRPVSRPSSAKRGTIIFNIDTGSFEGFNGKDWIAL